MPSDIVALLKDTRVALPTASDDAPHAVRSWGARIVSDLYLFAAYLASGRLRIIRKGLPEQKGMSTFLHAIGVDEERFRVLPSGEIVIPARLAVPVLIQLFQIAELAGPSTCSLTKESLRQAMDDGWQMERIVHVLATSSHTGLPDTVKQLVTDIGHTHGHIKLGLAGCYLEVEDPLLLVELKAHKVLKPLIRKAAGDRVALLDAEDPSHVAKLLKKLGYLPVVEAAPSEVAYRHPAPRRYGWRY